MKTDNLFLRFLNDIQTQVSQNAYTIWFSKLELLSIVNNVVTIKVPMEIHKQMLSVTYGEIIDDAFFAMTGMHYTFKYITEDEVDNFVEPVAPEETKEMEIEWNTNLNPKFTFDNYVVGNSNRLAFVAARAVAEAPGTIHNPLFIYGRSGIGKTHLMQAIGNYIKDHSKLKVLYTTSNEFRDEFTGIATSNNKIGYANDFKNKYRNVDVLIIDDIQFLVEAEKTQQEFFHTFNSLYQDRKQIVISSDKPPKEMETLSERLRTRFEMGLPVDIQIPTYETKMAIIKRKAELSELDIPYEVQDYVATHIKSSIRELEGALTKLSAFSKLSHTDITVEFAEQTLKDLISPDAKKEITPELIIQTVADHFNVKYDDIISSKRNANIVHPRQIAMYLCRQMTTAPLQAVGKALGNRDHTTVIHGAEKIAKEVVQNESVRNTIDIIIKKINPS